ncbi:MAG: hypothetical protein ACKVOQ_01270 [Cyclobacteriaceae bacterium]
MTTKALKRGFLMIAGILSVVVIVLTQSFYQPSESFQKKAKTEQADQNSKEVSIHAPSDMVPHGNTVAVNESTPSIAERVGSTDEPKKAVVVVKKVFITFFKTLFRVIIAPNAP